MCSRNPAVILPAVMLFDGGQNQISEVSFQPALNTFKVGVFEKYRRKEIYKFVRDFKSDNV